MSDWSPKLLMWFEANKRDMPWRNTKDPYKIWLSEVILQQTRVNQGWNYYLKFVETYPTVKDLASASEHDVLKLWQGLGYYSRARNMHHAAKEVVSKHRGKFPSDYESIRSLKGVGDYTAAAIASISYNLPHAVVDGNVLRVYSRVLGISAPIDSTEGKKKIWEAAAELLPHKHAGSYNQAIMELGALRCTPKNPNCIECPIQGNCYAYAKKLTDKLPVKQGKTKQRERHFYYLVIENKDAVLLHNRTKKDIWQGLHDFPCIETEKPVSPKKLVTTKEWKEVFVGTKPVIKSVSESFTHILSHQKLNAYFIQLAVKKPLKKKPENCIWVKRNALEKYAVPRLIERYIRKYLEL